MKNGLLVAFFVTVISGVVRSGVAAEPAITQNELARRTQALFDSVAPGNQEPFKKYFAEDAMFFDEKGRSMDKAALVKDIQPMPKGYSGTIKLVRPAAGKTREAILLDEVSCHCDLQQLLFATLRTIHFERLW
jgi:hypothetical protein